MTTLELLALAVASGKSKDAKALSQRALAEAIPPAEIVERSLVPAMAGVGDRFKRGEIFVPEMLVAARAMKETMAYSNRSSLCGHHAEVYRVDRNGAGRSSRHRKGMVATCGAAPAFA
jgi:methanogenic corrinoid protein MtbC1